MPISIEIFTAGGSGRFSLPKAKNITFYFSYYVLGKFISITFAGDQWKLFQLLWHYCFPSEDSRLFFSSISFQVQVRLISFYPFICNI